MTRRTFRRTLAALGLATETGIIGGNVIGLIVAGPVD
jgi:hypothetical protein